MSKPDRTINSILTDDCFHLLFAKFALSEQVHLRAVCHHWFNLLEQTFHGKQTLKLFGSRRELAHYLYGVKRFKIAEDVTELSVGNDTFSDVLIIKNVSKSCEVSLAIAKLFPNVCHLIFYCAQLVDNLAVLLEKWNATFISLILISFPENVPQNFWVQLSNMPHLERLFMIKMFRTPIPTPLQVLSQLKHFEIDHYTHDVVPVLAQLGPQLESLKLGWATLSVAQLELLIELNPSIVSNLKKLTFGGMISCLIGMNRLDNFRLVFDLICRKFQNLSFLDIVMCDHLPMVQIIPSISKLPNLTELWLYISSHQLQDSNPEQLPQLLTIRHLYLEMYDIELEQFNRWVVRLFPNITTLTIRCEDCKHNFDIDQLTRQHKTEFKRLERFNYFRGDGK